MLILPTMDTPDAYLDKPLPNLAAWTHHFYQADVPVLSATAHALAALREVEDDVDAALLTPIIESDPFMTIKLMAYVASRRKAGECTSTETVTSSLVMVGVSPFFRRFIELHSVEDRLSHLPEARQGLNALLQRARRAAHFALAFAIHRGDTDADVIREAAFLHDFAEMLMWCHAPGLELEIRTLQRTDPTLRTTAAQRQVLGIELDDLRQALMKLWHFPELLVRISDGKHPDHPNVRNVVLACRLARHTEQDWNNPALADDVNEIALLLNASTRVALSYLRKINLEIG